MEFDKYNSIDNASAGFIGKIYNGSEHYAETFYVKEKVHGANAQLKTDGVEVKFGKRSGFVDEGEKFYNYLPVYDRYMKSTLQLFNLLNEHCKQFVVSHEIKTVTIYGELFGGGYNHPEVERIPNAAKVQREVEYCQHQDFIAFGDVKINDSYLIDQDLAIQLLKDAGFLVSPILFKGTLMECVAYPNDFITKIPELFNLPPIEDNICEGTVITSKKPLFFPNGKRLIMKNKNSKFSEKKSVAKTFVPKPKIELSDVASGWMQELLTYITDNRLRNVISKIGAVTNKDFAKLSGNLVKDCLDDYYKDCEYVDIVCFDGVEKEEFTEIKRLLKVECDNLVRSNIAEIVAGDY